MVLGNNSVALDKAKPAAKQGRKVTGLILFSSRDSWTAKIRSWWSFFMGSWVLNKKEVTMKKMVLVLIVTISIPVISAYGEPYMKFVKVKKVDQGHIFVYQCDNTGNAIEVEQRYNTYSKSEEIRFITNGQADEWITKGINGELFRYFGNKSCEKSITGLASVL
jgi:hypothetical protein